MDRDAGDASGLLGHPKQKPGIEDTLPSKDQAKRTEPAKCVVGKRWYRVRIGRISGIRASVG